MEKGTEVFFKDDKEGRGVVVEVIVNKSWDGSRYNDYVIAVSDHPKARFSYEHKNNVVIVDEDHVWER